MMHASEPTHDHPPHADSVLNGTLCLMSCFVQHRLPLYAQRIADNLELLARSVELTVEMRTLCRRLATRWDDIRVAAAQQTTMSGPPNDARALH